MSLVRGLKSALNQTGRFPYKDPEYALDYLVIGGGVVGLAVTERLVKKFPQKSTFLVERHERFGEETSSRNSEVIHSGIYYPPTSLKSRLCIRGRDLLYQRCRRLPDSTTIPFRQAGKLIVAHSPEQVPYLERLHHQAQNLLTTSNVPAVETSLVTGSQACREMEPNLSPDIIAALWVPQTGIVDSHALMNDMQANIPNEHLVRATRVVRIDRSKKENGWVVQFASNGKNAPSSSSSVLVGTVINAAGLSAPLLTNSIISDPDDWITMYFAKGAYSTYSGPGVEQVSHLIYPCPATAGSSTNTTRRITGRTTDTSASFQSLGTHLTMDLQGQIKFGPDLQWISPPANESHLDSFLTSHLRPSEGVVEEMCHAVQRYLSDVRLEGFSPGYVGIRPKLAGPGATSGFQDFVIRKDELYGHQRETSPDVKGSKMFISLLGIESPGLTASLGLAEMVVDEVICG